MKRKGNLAERFCDAMLEVKKENLFEGDKVSAIAYDDQTIVNIRLNTKEFKRLLKMFVNEEISKNTVSSFLCRS